jgi:iron complex outermembrane recepter protein
MRVLWIGLCSVSLVLPARAETQVKSVPNELQGDSTERLDGDRPATTVKEWMAQIEASRVQVTGVSLNPTEAGLEIILQTAEGNPLSINPARFRSEGNSLIAEIPNAVLALPEGQAFTADSPTTDIATVQVVQQAGDQVRVTVVGKEALPTTVVRLRAGQLAYNLTPETGEEDAEDAAAEEEIVATGEQEQGYRAPDTSVGTRTDTPLRDIPQSIQVVPQQVIKDTQARSITEALENVPGVVAQGSGAAGTRNYFKIRGFEAYGSLVDGLPDPQITSDGIFFNVERLEVLKGPASVLYGDSGTTALGGTINYVTKLPLSNPFVEASATFGNYNFYQAVIDSSGPIESEKNVLYRLIAGFRNDDSIVDFNAARTVSVAPSLSFKIGKQTNLILEGDINILERNGQQPGQVPVLGTVLPNPNGKIPRSFNPTGPVTDNLTLNGRVGYRLEHKLNDNWKLRNAFRYTFYRDDDRGGAPDFSPLGLDADNRTLNREAIIGEQNYNFFLLDTNVLGKFKTGKIEHQLLAGFTLSRTANDFSYEFGAAAAPVDIFNPVYNQTVTPGRRNFVQDTRRDTLGIYLQDQITLLQNLKLLVGGRFDALNDVTNDRLANTETSQSDTAFSPRVGIVYQPIPQVSLYASYARSFTPVIGVARPGVIFEPERGTQYELGIKADVTSRLSLNLALYELTRSNVTTADPTQPILSVQSGKQRSRGIEFDVSGEILPGWNIIAGYAYTDARVVEDNSIPSIVGNRLFSAPEHAINLWTTYRIQKGVAKGLGFGLGLYYLGERPIDNANTVNLPGFLRTDAAIFYERNQFRAALSFRNIFDIENYVSRYGSSDFVQQGTPFTVQGTVSWRF